MAPKMSERDFDCLRTVEKLSANGWPARLKDISSDLNVRGPTALGFLDSLVRKSLVERGPTGYRSTESGTKLLRDNYRAHRVFESLLYKLGVPLGDACEMSSKVDETMDARAVDVFCSYLGHPRLCPHGLEIPENHRRRRGRGRTSS
jgi:DtxR family Mn-dependent transcriptional regulator